MVCYPRVKHAFLGKSDSLSCYAALYLFRSDTSMNAHSIKRAAQHNETKR